MLKVVCKAFGPPETLERIDVPPPTPDPNEVLVHIDAAGVGFVDGLMIQGLYQIKPQLPYAPGSEFSGVVTALGADVSTLKVGDRVIGLSSGGAFADCLTISANALIPIPANLDSSIAAGLWINYATALYGLRDCGHLQPGENVLILGAAGGVGSAAISVAKAMGARVIAAASSAEKRQAALAYGADEVLDYSRPQWRDELKTLTQPRGLNLVYDPVGGDTAEPAFRSLAPGGRFLVVGFASGTIPKLAFNLALLKQASLIGVDWGGASRANPSINITLLNTILEWIENEQLIPAAVTTKPMHTFKEALEQQLAGRILGKLVLLNTHELQDPSTH